MYQNINLRDGTCCSPPMQGLRILSFPDGTQVGIIGLDAVMEALFREGKQANASTATEIIERLKYQNYFEPCCREQYEELFLAAYQQFLDMKSKSSVKEEDTMSNRDTNEETKKKEIFSIFKRDKKNASGSRCCNLKIVPVQEDESENKNQEGHRGGG